MRHQCERIERFLHKIDKWTQATPGRRPSVEQTCREDLLSNIDADTVPRTARVSTTAQLLDRQLRALDDAGCAKVFSVPELGVRSVSAAPTLDTVLAALPEDTRPTPDVTKYDELLPSHRQPRTAGP